MADTSAKNHPAIHSNHHFVISFKRAFMGAILFAFLVIMTVEMVVAQIFD